GSPYCRVERQSFASLALAAQERAVESEYDRAVRFLGGVDDSLKRINAPAFKVAESVLFADSTLDHGGDRLQGHSESPGPRKLDSSLALRSDFPRPNQAASTLLGPRCCFQMSRLAGRFIVPMRSSASPKKAISSCRASA